MAKALHLVATGSACRLPVVRSRRAALARLVSS